MPPQKKPVILWEITRDDGTTFYPSEQEKLVVSRTFELFRRAQEERDRAFAYFDGMDLITYIEDSVERFNTNLFLREGMEDWQAGFNDGFTRNKVLAILGKIIAQLPIASAMPRGEEDTIRAQIITDLYQYTEEIDDYLDNMTYFVLETVVKGTGIGYEDIEYKKRKRRMVKKIGDEMVASEETIKDTKFYTEIVPLEEYYPADVGIKNTKDQPYAFWRRQISFAKFLDIYGHYQKADLVKPHNGSQTSGFIPYYQDYISSDVHSGHVELIKYYDQLNDQYILMANGIWLNPLGSNEEVQPLPWNHKEMPFYDAKFEPFGPFLYGKSLPSKLSSMQDILNVLQNMTMDQSFLSIFTPILTAGFDDFEDDYLRPGRRTSIDTGGLSLNQAIMPLQFPTPSGWHQYILEYTRRIMEESSVDQVQQGVAGDGADRTTAFEIQTAAAGVASMLTMFARFVNTAIKRKAMLRIKNILQFGFQPNATIIPGVLADTNVNKPFMTFSFNDTELTEGTRGIRVLEVYRDKDSLPDRDGVRARAELSKIEQGRPVEIDTITPRYLQNVEFDLKLGLDRAREESTQAEQQQLFQNAQMLAQLGGERVNIDEILVRLADSMGLDPTKIISEGVFNPKQQHQQPTPGQTPQPGQQPQPLGL